MAEGAPSPPDDSAAHVPALATAVSNATRSTEATRGEALVDQTRAAPIGMDTEPSPKAPLQPANGVAADAAEPASASEEMDPDEEEIDPDLDSPAPLPPSVSEEEDEEEAPSGFGSDSPTEASPAETPVDSAPQGNGVESSRQQEEDRQREAVRSRLRQQELEREKRRQELAAKQRGAPAAVQAPQAAAAGPAATATTTATAGGDAGATPQRLEGELHRKSEFEAGGKRALIRSWKQVHAVAADGHLSLSHGGNQVSEKREARRCL